LLLLLLSVFLIGTATGYVVDYYGIGEWGEEKIRKEEIV